MSPADPPSLVAVVIVGLDRRHGATERVPGNHPACDVGLAEWIGPARERRERDAQRLFDDHDRVAGLRDGEELVHIRPRVDARARLEEHTEPRVGLA
ncbi:hypothetical protein GCM10025876_33860 [Demequina litorisediminis]|uniref:Uncharacterized protein n=1 Tax=Demequina litorisediminis TaxID=1849022 RepID=A0ABQ6IGY2_9MICO|nr:hypothetical protein GCM10025876_33860 [Demequina litorisediminis]